MTQNLNPTNCLTLNELLSQICAKGVPPASFQVMLDFLESSFQRAGQLEKPRHPDFKWPKGSGVYLIWHGSELLYIGKTGTYKQSPGKPLGMRDEQRGFSKRVTRWTPYGFYDDRFCYGLTKKLSGKPKIDWEQFYKYSIPVTEIKIDCFVCGRGAIAPAFLEALLLQSYLAEKNCLPPANNAF